MNFGFSEVKILNSAWKKIEDAGVEANKIVNDYKSSKKTEALRLLGNPRITVLVQPMQVQ